MVFKRVSGCHDITEYIRINAHVNINPEPVLETSRGALYYISTGKIKQGQGGFKTDLHTHAVKTLNGSVCVQIYSSYVAVFIPGIDAVCVYGFIKVTNSCTTAVRCVLYHFKSVLLKHAHTLFAV